MRKAGNMEINFNEQGKLLMEQLQKVLDNIGDFRELPGDGSYQAFLHGQAAGLVVALKIMFPGDENLGDQASNLAAPVLGENKCGCHDHDMEEEQGGE